jgi:hypothetical protein
MLVKSLSRSLLFSACLLAAGGAWAASPTLHEVYQAAQSGRYDDAQRMMDQVLRDHPDSAKAHFVEAELLARQGKLSSAQVELGKAQKLDSTLSFAKPEAISELKQQIAAAHASVKTPSFAPTAHAVQAPVQQSGSHMPWGLILVGGAILAAGLMFMRSRNNGRFGPGNAGPGAQYGGSPYGGGPAGGPTPYQGGPGYGGPGYGAPGYGGYPPGQMPQAGGGMGSRIAGGLATGAAVGAGIVAGEALAHRVFGDGSSAHNVTPQQNNLGNNTDSDPWRNLPGPAPTNVSDNGYDMGGNDFGVNDANSWDNNSDFGAGGGSDDDWT